MNEYYSSNELKTIHYFTFSHYIKFNGKNLMVGKIIKSAGPINGVGLEPYFTTVKKVTDPEMINELDKLMIFS